MAKPETAPSKPRLRAALFVSLALNLAFVGLAAGIVLRAGPDRSHVRDGRDPVVPYTRAFDAAQRDVLRGALRDGYRNARGDGRIDLLTGYREALAVLRAEAFDPAAMQAVLGDQARRSDERRRRGQGVLVDFLTAMSDEERRAYADRLEAELDRIESLRARWLRD